jgi:DNA (cytosine-5)-methyltransferase 1
VSTLDVVAEVLREVAPRALRAREIVQIAGRRLPTESRTPATVVSRDLALDVMKKESRFLRVERGEFVIKHALPTALYNDSDTYAAAWSRNLIEAGELPQGVVDERSIRDLRPVDVAAYRQFHAFSGIGTWARALRDAGWPEEWPCWTGSAPCQPISQAGRRRGAADDRHLWPEWFRLIKACRPPVVFSEQVASKDGLAWLDALHDDLERAGYSVRAIDSCAASVGAPHIRQRFYIVAVSREGGRQIFGSPRLHDRGQSGNDAARCGATDGVGSGELGDARLDRAGEHGRELPRDEAQHEERTAQGAASAAHGTAGDGGISRELVRGAADVRPGDRVCLAGDPTWGGAVGGFWAANVEWIYCRPAPGHEDGCFRPAGSGVAVLVDGSSPEVAGARAKKLRAIGNAIVLPQAAEFVRVVIDALADGMQESAA